MVGVEPKATDVAPGCSTMLGVQSDVLGSGERQGPLIKIGIVVGGMTKPAAFINQLSRVETLQIHAAAACQGDTGATTRRAH